MYLIKALCNLNIDYFGRGCGGGGELRNIYCSFLEYAWTTIRDQLT